MNNETAEQRERAKEPESPVVYERAEAVETPILPERAVDGEISVLKERSQRPEDTRREGASRKG